MRVDRSKYGAGTVGGEDVDVIDTPVGMDGQLVIPQCPALAQVCSIMASVPEKA